MVAYSERAYSASGVGIASISADAFLSSIGVDIHVDQGVSGASYIAPLRYLGVRNVRDEGRNSSQIQLIHQNTGIRLDLVGEGDLEGTISTGKALAVSGALMAFEGPNEPNNFPIIYNGQRGGGGALGRPSHSFKKIFTGLSSRIPIYCTSRCLRFRKQELRPTMLDCNS